MLLQGSYRILSRYCKQSVPPPLSVGAFTLLRLFSSHRFNPNLEYFSAGSAPIKCDKGSYCVSSCLGSSEERPLTLLVCWLMSKEKHIKKFANFYNDRGFDVLKVRITPYDVMRPTKGSQLVAAQMLEFLHQNPRHTPLLVHGFSVGCYLFCEGLVQIEKNMDRHGPLLDRFVGQIWDSPVDVYAVPEGVSKIASNKNMQLLIKKYLEWYLRAQHHNVTVHFERASKHMNEAFLSTPAMFLFSKTDPISNPQQNALVYNNWAKKGIPVYHECFDSPHVSHFFRHPDVYTAKVDNFLRHLGLLNEAQRGEALVR